MRLWTVPLALAVISTRASVGFASPEVARRADGKAVTLVDGTSFDVSVTNKLAKLQRYELEVQVSGAGTLSVLRGGEPFNTFTAGTEKIQFTGSDPLESFAFSFAGEGSADILSCRPCFGMIISFR